MPAGYTQVHIFGYLDCGTILTTVIGYRHKFYVKGYGYLADKVGHEAEDASQNTHH